MGGFAPMRPKLDAYAVATTTTAPIKPFKKKRKRISYSNAERDE
jgi:hypothetical protein